MTPAIILSLIWTAWVWWRVKDKPMSWGLKLRLIPAAFIAVLLGAPGIWQTAMTGYVGDSYWTLGFGGRVGVVLISTVVFTLIFALISVRPIALSRLPLVIQLIIAATMGLLFYSVIYTLSPQIFYTFYWFIFSDLPVQIVVSNIIDFDRIKTIANLANGGSLSDHLAGLGFWAVLPFTLWISGRR